MTPLDEFLAAEVKDAIKGAGTNESVLIEIICTRSNAEIAAIKAAYQRCESLLKPLMGCLLAAASTRR